MILHCSYPYFFVSTTVTACVFCRSFLFGICPFFLLMDMSSLYIRYTDSLSFGHLDRKKKFYSRLMCKTLLSFSLVCNQIFYRSWRFLPFFFSKE